MDSKHHTARDLTKTSPSQLANLMGLDETQPLWTEQDHAAILRHLMDSPIPGDSNRSKTETFGHLLSSRHPNVDHLRHIKDFAKSCRSDPDSSLPHDIATIVYYAAISAARLRCDHAISQLSLVELRDGINWALNRDWLPEPLKQLFQATEKKLPAHRHG
jgi:hypothetical protein